MLDRVHNSSVSGSISVELSGSGLLGFEIYQMIGLNSGSGLKKRQNLLGFLGLWVQEKFPR